jgi:enoyl-CoA hydratase/carnithine racemase
MTHVVQSLNSRIAVVTLKRGKVNALNEEVVAELDQTFDGIADDPAVQACILTGHGSFFSFGFDVPGFMKHTRAEFSAFLDGFTGFYTKLFTFPKPVVAALNGHTVAGGCMLAIACDRRIVAEGRGKIALNEVSFGASVFAGCVAMLQACVGHHNAEQILFTGAMLGPTEALDLGLVERVVSPAELIPAAEALATDLAGGDATAFTSIKRLLREPIAEQMRRREADSIREFVDIWYSEPMRQRLREIKIRD